jgi:hypothetical protein
MADPTICVSAKFECKDLFDKALKDAVLKQAEETVEAQVNKAKGLSYESKCKEGWHLTVTIDSVKVDDPKNADTIEAKVSVSGVSLGGAASGFKASGNAKASGINAKKLEKEAKMIVHEALDDLMAKRVVPQLSK